MDFVKLALIAPPEQTPEESCLKFRFGVYFGTLKNIDKTRKGGVSNLISHD